MDYRVDTGEEMSELPSEAMEDEFELWNEEYDTDELTDLTSSQIRKRRLRFEARVERLVVKHSPGRLIAEDPFLARSVGKPAYTPEQWEQAREIIRREAEKVGLRFDKAEGIVKKEEKRSQREWYTKVADAITPDSWPINLG